MLAAFTFAEYRSVGCELRPGDRFLLYTDGLLEAANSSDEFFGAERLKGELMRTGSNDPETAADAILDTIRMWTIQQDDDLTLIVCD